MRLIDAEKLHDCIMDNDIHNGIMSVENVYEFIDTEPTVDAVPVVHGKWIGYETNSFKNSCKGLKRRFYLCSVCRTANAIRGNYCQHCGAKMDLEG